MIAAALVGGCRKSGSPPAKSWYDAAPLLESLRSEERAGAAQAGGAKTANELTLYDLELRIDDELDKFELDEELWLTNTYGSPLDEVVLRIYANVVGEKPPVKLENGSCSEGPSCQVTQPEASVIAIKPKSPLLSGARTRVKLRLNGELRPIDPSRTTLLGQSFESLERIKSGKGGGDYGLLARGDDIASLASFYPVLARFRDGKWERAETSTMGDLGADRISHVRAKISVPEDARVVSVGSITNQTTKPGSADSGARREVSVVAALIRDFALLVSKKFESASRKVGPVEVRSHYLGRDKQAGERVLDAAAASLAVYEKLFGRYPYVDLDVAEAPLVGGAGGVEFSGLVTVASMLYHPVMAEGPLGALAGLLGGPNQAELGKMMDSMLEFTAAHEVAHQYWPGLVGSDSRSHPWLDESLAQWSAVLYFRDRYGEKRAAEEADRQVSANYHMMRLMGVPDAAVDRPVEAFGNELAYAGLVYGKGPYFFRDANKKLGEQAFFTAFRRYLEKNRFQSVSGHALIDELAQGEHQAEMRALAKRWLDEAHGDEDLGKPDMRRLLAGFIGEDAAKNMGPEMELAMKLLLKFMAPGGSSGKDSENLLDLLLKGGDQ